MEGEFNTAVGSTHRVSLNPFDHADIEHIVPIKPAIHEFTYNSAGFTDTIQSLPEQLTSLPSSNPAPSGFNYPCSPLWHKNLDHSYIAGTCYAAEVPGDPVALANEREYNLSICVPPGIDPTWNGSRYIFSAVTGCVEPPASIPMRLDVSKNGGSFTYACYHTLNSIQELYPDIYPEVESLAVELKSLVLGTPSTLAEELFPKSSPLNIIPTLKDSQKQLDTSSCPTSDASSRYWTQRPIYTYDALKKNNRSQASGSTTQVLGGGDHSFNGSYFLASTIEQGHGNGTLKPATQVANDAFQTNVGRIAVIMNKLYQIIVSHSVTCFEWEMAKFHFEDNNIFAAGGLGPGPVAIQMNVSDTSTSITGEDLAKDIGRPQGSLHVDPGDSPTDPSLVVLILNLPKGAAGGSFLLARYDNIAGDTNYHYIDTKSLDFNFLESGHQEEMEFLLAVAVKRVALVGYIPGAAAYRTGNVAVSPSIDFGNTGTLTRADAKPLKAAFKPPRAFQGFGAPKACKDTPQILGTLSHLKVLGYSLRCFEVL
ncbi:hypothetical protein EV361DRAFT_1018150 [Lentinula raphanica]|nr:hypothetical protein EV361DRAFT_1018150 [Lentinula raphanica]